MKNRLFRNTLLSSILWALAGTEASRAALKPVLYVSNRGDDTVSMISLETLRVVDTIRVGDQPASMALTPDGSRLYVVNYASHDVSVIDTLLHKVISTVGVGASSNEPSSVAISPDGRRAYVANSGSASISVIDTASNSVEDTIPTPPYPSAIAHHPIRDELWLGFGVYRPQGTIVLGVLSTIDYSMLASATSGVYLYGANGLRFTPDGSEVFGTESCGCCGRFHRISGTHSNGVISILQAGLFEGGNWAVGVAVHPSNGTAYFAQQGHCKVPPAPRLSELGGANRVLPLSLAPAALGITPDGNRLCIAQGTSILVLDRASFTTVTNIAVGTNPSRIVTGLINREPVLTISVAAVEVCWNSASNAHYQVEYRTNLTTDAWQPLGAIVTGTGFTNCITDSPLGLKRFYRVQAVE
jgi:YVTN family beta-propeller protein